MNEHECDGCTEQAMQLAWLKERTDAQVGAVPEWTPSQGPSVEWLGKKLVAAGFKAYSIQVPDEVAPLLHASLAAHRLYARVASLEQDVARYRQLALDERATVIKQAVEVTNLREASRQWMGEALQAKEERADLAREVANLREDAMKYRDLNR